MATKQKIWIDGRGQEVPAGYVGKYDKARDKAGLEAIERSENRMTFEQFTKRGVVKAVLPDLPPTKDLNKIAKTFGLPLPTGETLKNVKSLVKSRGLGVYIKFMQKAYAFTRQKKLPLTWEAFGETANTYLKLSYMKTEQY